MDWLIDSEVERRKDAEPIGFEASGRLEIDLASQFVQSLIVSISAQTDHW